LWLMSNANFKKLPVPYYSQRLDVADPFWQPRSCGVVALKMAMDFLAQNKADYKTNSLSELIAEGVSYKGHSMEHGWYHDALLKIARSHGFAESFRKEWASAEEKKEALQYIIAFIEDSIPVVASIKSATGGHLVLLVGYSDDGLWYHDPDAYDREKGKFKFIAIELFLEAWKGRIIVIK